MTDDLPDGALPAAAGSTAPLPPCDDCGTTSWPRRLATYGDRVECREQDGCIVRTRWNQAGRCCRECDGRGPEPTHTGVCHSGDLDRLLALTGDARVRVLVLMLRKNRAIFAECLNEVAGKGDGT
jgi:hypothetical protein